MIYSSNEIRKSEYDLLFQWDSTLRILYSRLAVNLKEYIRYAYEVYLYKGKSRSEFYREYHEIPVLSIYVDCRLLDLIQFDCYRCSPSVFVLGTWGEPVELELDSSYEMVFSSLKDDETEGYIKYDVIYYDRFIEELDIFLLFAEDEKISLDDRMIFKYIIESEEGSIYEENW